MEIVTKTEAKERGLKHYFTGKSCKRGHVSKRLVSTSNCVECSRERSAAIYHANKNDPEFMKKRREYCNKWTRNNREQIAEYGKKYATKNRAKLTAQNRAWYRNNAEKMRKYHRRYLKEKRRTDPCFRIGKALRIRLWAALKHNIKKGSAVRNLGCSLPELKRHLESQFQPGMSWDNYGLHGWHIDHIIPFASFDLTDREQLKQACHWTNLQPLWAADNLSKGAKHPHD